MLAGTALSASGLNWPARAELNWKKYAGTKLEVILAKGPRGDTAAEIHQGIHRAHRHPGRVRADPRAAAAPEGRDRAHLRASRASTSSISAITCRSGSSKRPAGSPTSRGFMKDPNLTAPDLVESDFSAAGLQYAKNDKGADAARCRGRSTTSSSTTTRSCSRRRASPFPKTLDEMVAAAEKLTDAKAGIYGFVGRGLRNANMTLWTNFFLNYGGEFLDAKGNILTDGPEAIEATKLYQRLLTKVAPPGVAGFNWMESLAAFTQGRAAMWIDGVGWAPPLEDPNASRVVGKVGYAMVPAGPKGQYSATYRRRHRHRGGEQEQGSRLSLLPVGGLEDAGRAAAAGRRRRAVPQLDPQRRRSAQGREDAEGVARVGDRLGQDQQARPAGRSFRSPNSATSSARRSPRRCRAPIRRPS